MDFLLLALTALGQESDFRGCSCSSPFGLSARAEAWSVTLCKGWAEYQRPCTCTACRLWGGDIDQGQTGFAYGTIRVGCEAGLVRPAGCPKSLEI